jgi:hypothetical protein
MTTNTYNTDFYQWTQEQAALIRQREFNRVDLDAENIAEEIESMGRREKHSLKSYLSNVLMHLLKWQYQPDRRCTSWELSIANGRDQIEDLMIDSPSLNPQLSMLVGTEYPRARRNACKETGLPLTTFPEDCPYTPEQITGDYFPE